MKKSMFSLTLLLVLTASCFADLPNEKVLRTFHSTFSKAQKVRWMEHADFFDVSFVQQGIQSNVRYDKKGNFMNCTRYYSEQQLPANILCKVKNEYADKKIFGITEMTTQDNINYFIKMYDSKYWFSVQVDAAGSMEVVEKYRKS